MDGHPCIHVGLTPVSEDIAEELGYGRVEMWVDPTLWIARRMEFWDVAGNPLKRIEAEEFEQIDDIWTVMRIEAENFKTGHQTVLTSSEVRYDIHVPDEAFLHWRLRQGLPAVDGKAR